MLSKYKFLLLFLCYSMFSNAQTADVNSGCVPLKVNFTAPAGSSTFYWDFKDGQVLCFKIQATYTLIPEPIMLSSEPQLPV